MARMTGALEDLKKLVEEPEEPTPEAKVLAKYIEESKTDRFTIEGEITPEMAAEMLKLNKSNRRHSTYRSTLIAKDIVNGRWRNTHQGLAFSKSGMLLDGQHRLHAIVAAGIPVQTNLTFGMDDEDFSVIDTGKTRTNADVLHIQGYPQAAHMATIARMVMEIEHTKKQGYVGKWFKPSPAEVSEWLIPRADTVTAALSRLTKVRHEFKKMGVQGLGAAFYLIAEKHNDQYVDKFCAILARGIGVQAENDAMFRIRQRFIGDPPTGMEMPALVIKAFNHWYYGKPTRALGWKSTEDFPEVTDGEPDSRRE